MRECVVSLDIGTTGIKAIAYGEDGAALGSAYHEYPLIVQSDTWIEQDAELWWRLSLQAMGEALAQGNGRAKCLSISSQGISIVPVDARCQPLANAISWLDLRAEAELAEILAQRDEGELFRLTGKRVTPAYVLPKLLWLRRHRPGLFQNAAQFLMPMDLVIAKLTGRAVTDHSLAGGTMLYDIGRQDWDEGLAGAFGIDLNWLPRLAWAGTPVGEAQGEEAARWGLEGALVVLGAQDQKAAALGAGLAPGIATISLGTAGAVEFLANQPVADPQRRIPCFSYTAPGQWVLESVLPTAGAALKWLRNTLFPNRSYDELGEMAAAAEPGCHGVRFLPHLAGSGSPLWRNDARGAFLGLSLNAGPEDLVRALMEGVAFQLRRNVEAARSLGVGVEALRVFGGGSKSSAFCGIIASATGIPVTAYGDPEVSCLGAAALAARGAGLDAAPFQAGREGKRVYEPALAPQYNELYQAYSCQEDALLCQPLLDAK